MSANSVTEYNNNIEVIFVGYRSEKKPDKWFCVNCFEELFVEITKENEYKYITVHFIKLSQFTDRDHCERSNYCTGCNEPLYDIDKETCQHSSPTSNKWLQRFRIKRHYGLQGGGTSP